MAVWFGLKEEIEKWEKKDGNIEYLCYWLNVYTKNDNLQGEVKSRGCYIVMLELPKIRKKWLEMMVITRYLRLVRSLSELINALIEVKKCIASVFNKEIKKVDLSKIRKKYSLLIDDCGEKDDMCYFEVYKPSLTILEGVPSLPKQIHWTIIEDYPVVKIKQTLP